MTGRVAARCLRGGERDCPLRVCGRLSFLLGMQGVRHSAGVLWGPPVPQVPVPTGDSLSWVFITENPVYLQMLGWSPRIMLLENAGRLLHPSLGWAVSASTLKRCTSPECGRAPSPVPPRAPHVSPAGPLRAGQASGRVCELSFCVFPGAHMAANLPDGCRSRMGSEDLSLRLTPGCCLLSEVAHSLSRGCICLSVLVGTTRSPPGHLLSGDSVASRGP